MALQQTPPTFTAVTTGSNEYSVQLNDTNLESKAWKSSRYDGSRTTTTALNKYNNSDKTYGKTAAAQKYSRNIYIGNGIIGMDGSTSEDASLVNFPNFSYVSTKKFITVNNDNTVTTTGLESQKLTNDQKIGFYRSFYEDFPISSDCQIILNDENIRSGLKDRYNIHFNGGTLKKLFHLQTPLEDGGNASNVGYISYLTASNGSSFGYTNAGGTHDPTQGALYILGSGADLNTATLAHTASLFNQEIYKDWFTGSLEITTYVVGIKNEVSEVTALGFLGLYNFFNSFFDYQNRFSYKGDKRLFITLSEFHTTAQLESGFNNQPIYTFRSGSYIDNGISTNKLSELSTVEVAGIQTINYGAGTIQQLDFLVSKINNLSFNYTTFNGNLGDVSNGTPQPPSFLTGSVIFSKTEDSTPSLLLPLVKAKELPDGTGRKSFVIIPENLHPHIKKNLTHFLAKAGVSLDLDTIPALDSTFEQLR